MEHLDEVVNKKNESNAAFYHHLALMQVVVSLLFGKPRQISPFFWLIYILKILRRTLICVCNAFFILTAVPYTVLEIQVFKITHSASRKTSKIIF